MKQLLIMPCTTNWPSGRIVVHEDDRISIIGSCHTFVHCKWDEEKGKKIISYVPAYEELTDRDKAWTNKKEMQILKMVENIGNGEKVPGLYDNLNLGYNDCVAVQ